MGSKGVGLASAGAAVVGLFVGIGVGRLVAGKSGQRTSGQADLMLALSAVGAATGAYIGGYAATQHGLALPASTSSG